MASQGPPRAPGMHLRVPPVAATCPFMGMVTEDAISRHKVAGATMALVEVEDDQIRKVISTSGVQSEARRQEGRRMATVRTSH